MGYTHYWDNSKEKATLATKVKFTQLFDAMLALRPDIIEVNKITDDTIWFNGIEDDSHETMCVNFDGAGNWEFCKTARKPYDEVVVACLVLAKELKLIDGWSSDGDADDHKLGKQLLKEAKLYVKDINKIVTMGSVELKRTSKHKYKVTYGKQITKGLDRVDALVEFVECIEHELQCEGFFD